MKSRFEHAWKICTQEYDKGRILNESTLQAVLFRELSCGHDDLTVCEPKLLGGPAYEPDIVVAREGSIVAVCELKFFPHHYPPYEDDLEKLRRYATWSQSQALLLDPATGKYASNRFHFSEDCLLVFAVIGRWDSVACSDPLAPQMQPHAERFFSLIHSVGG